MYCINKCIVHGKQARVKNADFRQKRKSASPVLNVLMLVVIKKFSSKIIDTTVELCPVLPYYLLHVDMIHMCVVEQFIFMCESYVTHVSTTLC